MADGGKVTIRIGVDQSGVQKSTALVVKELQDVEKKVSDVNKDFDTMNKKINKAEDSAKDWGKETVKQTNSVKSAVNSTGTAFSKLAGIVAGAVSLYAIIQFGKESSSMAMSVEASVQRVADIFGEAGNEIYKFQQTSATALGLSERTFYEYAATYGNLFSTFMDDPKEMADLTQQYLTATAVVASKTGRTMEDVAERIRSGLLGNTESIEDLGINVNVAMIEMTDSFKMLADGKSWEQLDFQMQSQIRQLAILEQANKKYGTSVSENSVFTTQQFGAALQNLMTTIGNLLNIFIVPLIAMLTTLLNTMNAFLIAIFGDMAKSSAEALLGTTQAQESVTDATDASIKSQEALGDEIDANAKKANKASANFDELNILSSGNTAGAGDVSASGGGFDTPALVLPEIDVTPAEVSAEKLKNIFSGVTDYWKLHFAPIFSDIWVALEPGATLFSENLKMLFSGVGNMAQPLIDLFNNSIIPFLTTTISEIGINILPSLLNSFNQVFSDIINIVLLPWMDTWVTIILPLFFSTREELVKTASVFITELLRLFDTVWVTITPLIQTFVTVWQGFWETIMVVWDEYGAPIYELIREAISVTFELLETIWITIVEPVVSNLVKILNDLWTDTFQPVFQNILEIIGEFATLILVLWNEYLAPIVDWLIVIFGPMFANVFNNILNVVHTVIDSVGGVINGLLTILKGLIQYITGVFTGDWDKAWEGIKNIFKGVWDSLYAIVKLPINLIVDGLNAMIKGIATLISSIMNIVVGGINEMVRLALVPLNAMIDGLNKIPGVNISKVSFELAKIPNFGDKVFQIPKLATGAVIPPNREFAAILGDQKSGTNIETPEALLRQIMQEELANMGGSESSKEEIYVLDRTELMRIVYKLFKGGEKLQGGTVR